MMEDKIVLKEQQQEALDKILEFLTDDTKYTFNLSGYSGTGKSTTVQFMIQAIASRKYIIACSPTHRANEVLQSMLGNLNFEVKTIASLFGLRYNPLTRKYGFNPVDEKLLPRNSLLIVDECSMNNAETQLCIVNTCIERNIKCIFIGDIAQIPPIGSDNVSLSFTDCDDSFTLTMLQRQKPSNPLVRIYSTIRDNMLLKHRFVTNINAETGEGLEIIPNKGQFMTAIQEAFSSQEFKDDKQFAKIICYRNTKVAEYNKTVREVLVEDSNIPYQVGELLTGYKQIASSNIVDNSKDYEILNNNGIITKRNYYKVVDKGAIRFSVKSVLFDLTGYEIVIRPINSTSKFGFKVFIPLLEEPSNQPFFINLYDLSQAQAKEKDKDRKSILYRAIVNIFESTQLNDSLFLYNNKCTSLTKMKLEEPRLFYNDDSGYSEFDRIMDDHKGFVLEKNLDYGYAVSCHKA